MGQPWCIRPETTVTKSHFKLSNVSSKSLDRRAGKSRMLAPPNNTKLFIGSQPKARVQF